MKWKPTKEYWRAIQVALVLQIICGFIASLDCGLLIQPWLIAVAAFWGGCAFIVTRRPANPTRTDLFLIRWAFPFLLFFVVPPIAAYIWKTRGF